MKDLIANIYVSTYRHVDKL